MIRDRLYVDGQLYQKRDKLAMDDAHLERPVKLQDLRYILIVTAHVWTIRSVFRQLEHSVKRQDPRHILTMTERVLVIHQAKATGQVPIKGVGKTVELN
jgi:hypothetical protein